MNQIETLKKHLESGRKIDRVEAFNLYGIADLRSRLSDVKRVYGLEPQRKTKEGKRYLTYWL
jgi:hypothetical protein